MQAALRVEPLEQVIDALKEQLRTNHIMRLKKGTCGVETGFVLSDILTNLERVSDHCSNVAVCLIEVHADEYDTHEYLNLTTKGSDPWFRQEYAKKRQEYLLP